MPHRNRLSSREKPPTEKHTSSFNATRKADSSMSKLYAPARNKSNSRYKPRSASETKPTSQSSTHLTSTDYEKMKMAYLKTILKKPQQETKTNREEMRKLINSIKGREVREGREGREERSASRPREKEYRSNTVSVSKSTKSTTNMFQSLQVDLESTPLKMSYSYRTRQGVLVTNPKKVNQDSLLIKTKIHNTNMHLFAVADGHGMFGHQISQLVAKNLSKYL